MDAISEILDSIQENVWYLLIGCLVLIYVIRRKPDSETLPQRRQQAKEELLHSIYSRIDEGVLPNPIEMRAISHILASTYNLPQKYVLPINKVHAEIIPYIAHSSNLPIKKKQKFLDVLTHRDKITFSISRLILERILVFFSIIILLELLYEAMSLGFRKQIEDYTIFASYRYYVYLCISALCSWKLTNRIFNIHY